MKIAIVGTGGVGGYFGGRLAVSGCDVHFVARGKHLEALRKQGLAVRSPLGDFTVNPVQATDDPSDIGPVDVVLISVKLWDTEAAAKSVAPLIGSDTAVISLQNGVEKDAVLGQYVSAANLVGGICYIAASIAEPGVIEHAGQMARVTFGEFDGKASARCTDLLAAFSKAGVTAELSKDIEREIWEKFVFLVGLSTMTALLRLPIGPIRSNAETRALLLDTMRETVAVGRAKCVRLDAGYADSRLAFCDTIPATMKSSMQVDLSRGNRLELDWLSGAVVRFGAETRVPTPVNRVAYGALTLYAAGAPSNE